MVSDEVYALTAAILMAVSFRNIGGERVPIDCDIGHVEELVLEFSRLEHSETLFSSHRNVGPAFDGFATIISRVDAAAVAGLSTNSDKALQERKNGKISIPSASRLPG